MNSREPIVILQELERRCGGHAFDLPRQAETREAWHGIGFRLGSSNFVAPLGQVIEILVSPAISRVPGAKAWVAGIANVRGTLLPVVDLKGFLQLGARAPGGRSRALVVEHGGVAAALLVDDVLGLKHFLAEDRTDALPDLANKVLGYLAGGFMQGGQLWSIFDMHRLVVDAEFMQVAA